MDQDMEADEFFPDTLISDQADPGDGADGVPTIQNIGKPVEGGDEAMNGDGVECVMEQMETEELPTVQEETDGMDIVEDLKHQEDENDGDNDVLDLEEPLVENVEQEKADEILSMEENSTERSNYENVEVLENKANIQSEESQYGSAEAAGNSIGQPDLVSQDSQGKDSESNEGDFEENVQEEAEDVTEVTQEEADAVTEVTQESDDVTGATQEETDEMTEVTQEEADAVTEVTQESDDVTEVTQEFDDVTEVTQEETDYLTEVTQEEADDVTEVTQEEADDETEVTQESDDVTEVTQEEADDVTEVTQEEADDETEVTQESDDVTEVTQESDDVTEVTQESEDVTEVTQEEADDVTDVTRNTPTDVDENFGSEDPEKEEESPHNTDAENQDVNEQMEPVETELQAEDLNKEEETSGATRDSDFTGQDGTEISEDDHVEAAGAEDLAVNEKDDETKFTLEESEADQSETLQDVEEDTGETDGVTDVVNEGGETQEAHTEGKDAVNLEEDIDKTEEMLESTAGDNEEEMDIEMIETRDWTAETMEEEEKSDIQVKEIDDVNKSEAEAMDVEPAVEENTEDISENIIEDVENLADKNTVEAEEVDEADVETVQQVSQSLAPPTKQDSAVAPPTEQETAVTSPTEQETAVASPTEQDSASAPKSAVAAPTYEEIDASENTQSSIKSEKGSEVVGKGEVTPSGDNANQVDGSTQHEATPIADNSNQSGTSIEHDTTPTGDNSNQLEMEIQRDATPTGDNSNKSEGSSGKKGTEFDISSVKIKQERKDSTESDKAADTDSGTSQMKIVGVTSAVGVEDKEDNPAQTSAKEDNSEPKRRETRNQVKVKQEAVAGAEAASNTVANEKTDIKKKVADALKQKVVKKESKSNEDDDVIAIKEEKKPVQKPKSSKIQTCIVCSKVGKCKYNIVRNGDVKHLCDDNCFKRFRSSPTTYLKQAETGSQAEKKTENKSDNKTVPTALKSVAQLKASTKQQPTLQTSQVYKTCTVCQLMNVRTSKPFLNWQGLDFCGEECLGKYQGSLSNNCNYCSGAIFPNNKAKNCCRVGSEVKHFCSANCNNEFVKRMKLCAYCSQDLALVKDSFMAPVGDTFKDFCSQNCLQKFEDKNNQDIEIVGVQKGQKESKIPKGNFLCAVCGKVGPVKHEFKLDSKMNRLCSDPCFSAFQYANKLTLNKCDNCSANLNSDNHALQYVQFEGQQRRFCSYMCVNIFRNTNKKTVPCAWCGNKKSNFDMIERVDANNKYQLFCSLNCLSLYRVNLQATSNQAVTCDQCRKCVPAQYHLTMSDASVRNFCSYGCVMQFQAQFQAPAKQVMQQNAANNTNASAGRGQPPTPQPAQTQTTTRSGRVVTKVPKVADAQQQLAGKGRGAKKDADSFPIISNVVSLAPQGSQHGQQQINIKSSTPVTVTNQQQGIKTTTTTTGNQTVQQQIIIQPPLPKSVKNKSLLCKPFTQTKATSCRPHTQTKEVQTEGKIDPEKYLIPVPVPIYCPTPLAMYAIPIPVPVPIPVPIPVPVFIPTTKKSANSILKQIKEIREKIPADPLEAELLMMAEAVAGKDEESSSSSEEEDNTAPPAKESSSAPAAPAPSGGDLGEDMLQMALRMASEMTDEPVMDLETSLEPVAVNTEPPPPAPKPEVPEPPPVEEEEEYIPAGTRTRRARAGNNKRPARNTPRRNPKRQKVEVATPPYREPTPSPPPPAAPPPDANFHLKYTYGVNAFKHWVIQKNNQLEQTSKPGQGKNVRTFKSDILQCTADELNFSLCLFVKEVRKPNGEEYAVDSIYYLCLGIQQYLFENGRIDNIFSDFYYDRFTEQLNEILTKYEPKLNHAGQLVCRIEEEHLWESKQLGAHSPHVLLNSLVYFNTKYFMLKTSEDHLRLSFTHIMKHWKKTANGRGSGTGPNAGRSVYLRYYCPTPQGKGIDNQKKKKEEMPVYEQTENIDNPLRCPVKLYEFYLSKCPESIKNRNDTFYLVPERSCVPDSPVWYSTGTLGMEHMAKMLNRIRLVREIQEAHLHTQPIYI